MEVDFVLKNDSIIPIGVKNKETVDKRDLKGMMNFLITFDVDRGYVVTRSVDDTIVMNNKKIVVMPVTKFILSPLLRGSCIAFLHSFQLSQTGMA